MISALPLNDLAQQLQIHPTTARKYLEELKISLNRVPGKAYQVTAEQADLLEQYTYHLRQGGTPETFQPQKTQKRPLKMPISIPTAPMQPSSPPLPPAHTSPATVLIEAIQSLSNNQLEPQRILEEAAIRQWKLNRQQIYQILNITRLPGSPFQRYGFLFSQVSTGVHATWKVEKL